MSINICSVSGCNRKARARNLCHAHLSRFYRYNDLRENQPIGKPGFKNRLKLGVKKGIGPKLYNRLYGRLYKKRTGYKSISAMHKLRFGGLRIKVLKRDNYTCQICGMTNKEHRKEFGREITLDHIDGNGRCSKEKNHSSRNLWTLCLRCHGRRDYFRSRLEKGYKIPLSIDRQLHKLESW